MYKPTCLLLEDDPVIAAYILHQLTVAGYTVYCAETMEETFDLCARHSPQVALLNFHFHRAFNGLQLAEAIYAQFAVYCCFITGSRQADIPGGVYQNYQWLHKPFTPKQIKTWIHKSLSLRTK